MIINYDKSHCSLNNSFGINTQLITQLKKIKIMITFCKKINSNWYNWYNLVSFWYIFWYNFSTYRSTLPS